MTADTWTTLLVGVLSATVALVAATLTQRRANRERVDAVSRAETERDAALARLDRQLKAQASDTATREARADERHQLDLSQARTRLLTDRFGRAAEQIGDDSPSVRVAGVHAMASLADEWVEQRQQCVEVLCGYMRLPCRTDSGERTVRLTIVRLIRDHLRPGKAGSSWDRLTFDLRGAWFPDGSSLRSAIFPRKTWFSGSVFDGVVKFRKAVFRGEAKFNGSEFNGIAQFSNVTFKRDASFCGATFYRPAQFDGSTFSRNADFGRIGVPGRESTWREPSRLGTVFNGHVDLRGATMQGIVDFYGATLRGPVAFDNARLAGSLDLRQAKVFHAIDLTNSDYGPKSVWLPNGRQLEASEIPANAQRGEPDDEGHCDEARGF